MKSMSSNLEKPSWLYRFNNFQHAFALLSEAMHIIQERKVNRLEQEGIIQRFEYTWELTWKVLKDYLEYKGVILDTITPSTVIKAALSANLITNGEVWMEALDARNKMSHTYDFKKFEKIIVDIEKNYYPALEKMNQKMLTFVAEGEGEGF